MDKLTAIKGAKTFRQRLDEVLQDMKAFKKQLILPPILHPSEPEQPNDRSEAIAQHTLSMRDLESAIMRQGMTLKAIGNPAGVPITANTPELRAHAAYDRYRDALKEQGTDADPWEDLEGRDRDAWTVAFGMEQAGSGTPYPQSYNPNSPVVEPTSGVQL